MIAYEDLDLRIQPDGDQYAVAARRGSQRAVEPFHLDLAHDWDIWAPPTKTKADVDRLGATLFDALIHGAIKNLYQQGRGGAGSDAARGIRLRIQIDTRDKRLRPLVRVPWEILLDRSADVANVLAVDPRRPIVRMVDSTEQHLDPAPLPVKRILLASAQPTDTVLLKLRQERATVEGVLSRHGVLPKALEGATHSSLQQAILEEQPQVFHFMGHGTTDPTTGEGLLLLEQQNRKKDPLPASDLARFFLGRRVPRLVILTSCLTGTPGPVADAGPFASVAAALVAGGLPAVIAMQTAIRDTNALLFTQRLYEGVVRGDTIEAAVASARLALQLKDREVPDWAAPVLFVRAHGGGVLAQAQNETSPRAVTPPVDDAQERRGSGVVNINVIQNNH